LKENNTTRKKDLEKMVKVKHPPREDSLKKRSFWGNEKPIRSTLPHKAG